MIEKPNNRKIALLFLAAGASRRMGRPKALLPWNGTTVIGHHFQNLETIGGFDPWIVTRPEDRPLNTELNSIGWPQDQRTVNPSAPDCEMIESILCGMRAVLDHPAGYPTVGIALIDQLLIRPKTFQILETEAGIKRSFILQPEYHGRRGHPVLLPRSIARELADFDGLSLRDFLESHHDFRTAIPVDDDGILKDMDTPAAYHEQLLSN